MASAFSSAPWLSWLQRPTVTPMTSEGREFEPHWGSSFFFVFLTNNHCFHRLRALAVKSGGLQISIVKYRYKQAPSCCRYPGYNFNY